MAIWLFRRKSRRKRARNGDDAQQQRLANRSNTTPDEAIATPPRPKSSIKKNKQRAEPAKLQRRARTYSFDADRRESLNVRKQDRQDAPPVPPLPAAHNGGNTASSENQLGVRGFGQDAVGDIQRIPTLHATKSKRDGHHLGPRKSSKRRKNSHDREREAELKAMSNFVPHRPATDQWTAGRTPRRDTRKVRTGLGIGLGSSKEERSSTISLPTPQSIHSTLSSDSEHVSFKVSAFSALAPKPTLRYSLEPRWTPPGISTAPLRGPSQRKRLSEKEPFPEATLKAHKRIHDLADDLDASGLRELMERDQRRRDKKRQSDQEKAERMLQRRAEKQRQAVASGSGPTPNMERGVLGREIVGLGIEPPSAVVTSSRSRESTPGKQASPVTADISQVEDEHASRGPSPIRSFHRTSSVPPEPHEEPAASEQEPEKLATVASQAQSPTRRGFLRVRKTRTGPTAVQGKPEVAPGTSRKVSESSPSRGPLSWASFFRWGNKNRRETGPSSFSNTSRDSMATMPQPAPPASFVPSRGMGSVVPRRTLSRFREDLPDFPPSPPESRLQSPEADDAIPPAVMEQDSPPIDTTADPIAAAEGHYDTPTSQHHSSDADHMRETPTSWTARDEAVASTEPQQSVSMASIDSEASWLSGRIGSRRSSAIQQHRRSATNSRQSQYQQRTPTGSDEAGDIAEEEMIGITDDEYLNQFARRPSAPTWNNRNSGGDPQASSDEELEPGDDARWGSVSRGRKPTMVQGHSVKSREGLLNMFDHDDEADPDSPTSPTSPISFGSKDAEAGVQHATSVNLGRQHARHISAGSTKLLEISPRNSVDQKGRVDF